MSPLVSVITPVYNREKVLKQTVESVLSQTFEDFEYILVNDASTDNSLAILEEFEKKDKRVKVINLEKNKGPAGARNAGVDEAKGRYIAFLDSDDIWNKEKLKIQLDFMNEKATAISFTSFELIDVDGNSLGKTVRAKKEVDLDTFLKCTCIGFSTSMIDVAKTGRFNFIDIPIRQDAHLWITLLKRGFVAYGIEKTLVKYRVHRGNISANKFKAALGTWNLYYKIEKLGFFKSLYYFSHYAVNGVLKRL